MIGHDRAGTLNNAARQDADHNATLCTIYRSFGDVRATDELLDLIARAAWTRARLAA